MAAEREPDQGDAICDGVPGRKIVAAFDPYTADEAIGSTLPLETQGPDGLFQSASVQQVTALLLLRRACLGLPAHGDNRPVSALFDTHVEIFDPIGDVTIDRETWQAHHRSAITARHRLGSQTMRHYFALCVEHAYVTKIGASHATIHRRRNLYFIERVLGVGVYRHSIGKILRSLRAKGAALRQQQQEDQRFHFASPAAAGGTGET